MAAHFGRMALVALAGIATFTIPQTVSVLGAQAPDAPAFEVASIKPNKTGEGGTRMMMQPGGRITVTNAPPFMLLGQAYRVQPFQILEVPAWMRSERFDIQAKAPEGMQTSPDTIAPMLRQLFEDRFKLKVRRETREMATYDLVLARADKKLGPRIEPSKTDCQAMMAARGRGDGRGGAAQAPPPPPVLLQPGQRPECGLMGGIGRIAMGGLPLSEFARMLGNQVQRIVVDKTGLTGPYSFELEFMPDQIPNNPGGPLVNGAVPAPPPDAPTLFTALQEQLGLKLEPSRGPVEVVVIESAERPSED